MKVESSEDGSSKSDEVAYAYYLHGPLKRELIGEDVQGVDYVYTLQGWLKSINSATLTRDPGKDHLYTNNAVASDVFGLEIDYFHEDYKRNGTHLNYGDGNYDRFGGFIQGIRWRTENISASYGQQWMYEYQYNQENFLKEANFGLYSPACQNLDYGVACSGGGYSSETGGTSASDRFTVDPDNAYRLWRLQYDKNGNITGLSRNAYGTTPAMDNLTYTYKTDKNQLDYVEDSVSGSAYNDFPSGQAASNYTYDVAGRLTGDVSEGRTYEYDYRGLPTKVYESAVLVQDIKYDAFGKRLKKITYSGGVLDKELYYIHDYAGSVTELHEENHGVMPTVTTRHYTISGLSRLGFYDRDSPEESRYELKDHLGNVRMVVNRDKYEPCSTCVVPYGSYALVSSYSDYYPWGMEMPNRIQNSSVGAKLAFQGQEVDEATGLSAFSLRYHDNRLGRWLSPDPYKQHYSPYLSMSNNPISFIDPDGGFDYTVHGGGMPDWMRRIDQTLAFQMWQEMQGELRQSPFGEEGWDWLKFKTRMDGGPLHSHIILRQEEVDMWLYESGIFKGNNLSPVDVFGRWEDPFSSIMPEKKDFSGTWGWIHYYLLGGEHSDGLKYNKDGEAVGRAPNMGYPDFGTPIKKATSIWNMIKNARKWFTAAKASIQLTKARFGHTFIKHGEDATTFLINRAKGSGQAQGQFLDNQKAAQFILDNVEKTANGAVNVPVPKGFPARVIMPDGTFKTATHVRLVPGGGGVKTAYPVIVP